MIKVGIRVLLGLFALAVVGAVIYSLPPVRARLDWRLSEWQARIKYALAPPEQAVFVPQQQTAFPTPTFLPSHTSTASPAPVTPTATLTGPTTSTALSASHTPPPTHTPTQTPTPLPERVQLTGVRHEFQTWNNCGPATLSMALSFWGWQGDQAITAPFLKPLARDKNVMPYEMAAFVEEQTDFGVVTRVGGKLELIKQFLAAGLPVLLEKGFEGPNFEGWMGHYVLVTGYDDATQQFNTQDSFLGPNIVVAYGVVESFWRAFNFTYLVVYPDDREAEVLAILGTQADETANDQHALQVASEEIYTLTGRDQFFAWFNRGTNLVALQDYAGAAAAYDEAFALYAELPEDERPWRMMWYQTGPYWAYYYTGRYADVINLATTTLDAMSEPVLEESYYWRALAREALGDVAGAIEDLQTSLEYHPGFVPSLEQLVRLGVDTP
ncbi:MAG: hypothetical protein Fur0022_01690 [Anaerolineales bacterium]